MNINYCWHDLLASPEELPEIGMPVLGLWQWTNGILRYEIYESLNEEVWEFIRTGVNDLNPDQNVICIAWSYFNRFGGDTNGLE